MTDAAIWRTGRHPLFSAVTTKRGSIQAQASCHHRAGAAVAGGEAHEQYTAGAVISQPFAPLPHPVGEQCLVRRMECIISLHRAAACVRACACAGGLYIIMEKRRHPHHVKSFSSHHHLCLDDEDKEIDILYRPHARRRSSRQAAGEGCCALHMAFPLILPCLELMRD